MKGIILAGGSGTRLSPLTKAISKQLLPIYNKPLIYYPLSVLMLAGIRDILIISTPDDLPLFKKLLKTGAQFGLNLTYAVQPKPEGLPQAFIIGEDFIGRDSVALCLGDNIFYGADFQNTLRESARLKKGAHLYAYQVKDPQRYGVVKLDEDGRPTSIVEKPKTHISDWALTGLYFYDNQVIEYAKMLKKSARNEFEIVDLHKIYLKKNLLKVQTLGRGFTWLDAGTFDSLLEAGNLVSTIENRQGMKICDPHDIAKNNQWI